MCEQTWQLLATARSRGNLQSREARLQVEVFGERRVQLLQSLLRGAEPIDESRLAKLEKLIAALLLSHDYFAKMQAVPEPVRVPGRPFLRARSGEASR